MGFFINIRVHYSELHTRSNQVRERNLAYERSDAHLLKIIFLVQFMKKVSESKKNISIQASVKEGINYIHGKFFDLLV